MPNNLNYITEETHKQNIIHQYFQKFNTELGKIDLSISKNNTILAWIEVKNQFTDIYKMFAQLFLTAKRELNRTYTLNKITKSDFAENSPRLPKYFGVFDNEKIAFVENFDAQVIFNLNDFNWNEMEISDLRYI